MEAVLLLLTDLATIGEAAETVRVAGLTQHTCLALLYLYQQNGDAKLGATGTRIKDLKVRGFTLLLLQGMKIINSSQKVRTLF